MQAGWLKLFLFGIVLSGILAVAGRATAQTPPTAPSDPAAILKTLTPHFPAPWANAVMPPGSDPGSLRLLGIDLTQNGAVLTGKHPKLDGNNPLELTFYWIPQISLAGRIPILVRFWSDNFTISRSEDLSAGPVAGEKAWQPGGVYTQKCAVNLPTVATVLSGDVYMTLQFPPSRTVDAVALMEQPVLLTPRVGNGRISRTLIEQRFPKNAVMLSKSFRLCKGALVTLPIRLPKDKTVIAIGLVSGYSYGAVPQDQPVITITVQARDGGIRTLPVRSGVHTARTDYDYYPVGSMNHQKIAILDSQDTDNLDSTGAPFQRHRYVSEIPLDPPVSELQALAFELADACVMDVFDVILLCAAPSVPSGTVPAAP